MEEQWRPSCSCRELGAFQPFGKLWLSDKGGVPTPSKARGIHNDFVVQTRESNASAPPRRHEAVGTYVLFPSHSDEVAVEEELYWQGTTVVHSCGQQIVKVVTASEEVLQALWCTFAPMRLQDDSPMPAEATRAPQSAADTTDGRATGVSLITILPLQMARPLVSTTT